VLIHEGVDYVISEADVLEAVGTAYAHCRPRGVAVFAPDCVTETFEPGTDCGGVDAPDGRAARYLVWSWDPDPADTWTLTDFAFLLRDADGQVTSVHETHRTGLFATDTWLRLLRTAGFEARVVTEVTTEERTPRQIMVGHRPAREA
jgi:hypothetical protein